MNGGIPWDLMAAAAGLLVNRVLSPSALRRAPAYYALQLGNVAAIAWFVLRGVAGLEWMRMPGLVIAGLFLMHVIANVSRRRRVLDHDPRPPWRRPPPT